MYRYFRHVFELEIFDVQKKCDEFKKYFKKLYVDKRDILELSTLNHEIWEKSRCHREELPVIDSSSELRGVATVN